MTHEVRAHSKLGASSMYRWRACPGSVRLSEGLPRKSSVYAAEGSVAHEIAEQKLRARVDPAAAAAGEYRWHEVGEIVKYDGHDIEVTQEMHDCVDQYVETIVAHASQPGCELLIEQRLDLSRLHPAMFGTSDAIVIDHNKGEVWVYDYKHGAGIAVDAEDNEQMQFYAVGALLRTAVPLKLVGVCIVQPRAFHALGPVRRWSMTPGDVFRFIDALQEAAEATEKPDAALAVGEHCRFCPAAQFNACPELKRVALETASQDFAVVAMPGTDAAPIYDPEELNRILRKLPAIKAWVERVESFAREEALAGRGSPGHKLVRGKGSRELKDVSAFRTWLELGQGIAFSAMHTAPALKSVAQIEKSLPKELVKEFKNEHTRTIPGGLVLTEIEDKRPAAQAVAAVEFQAVTVVPE